MLLPLLHKYVTFKGFTKRLCQHTALKSRENSADKSLVGMEATFDHRTTQIGNRKIN